MPKKKPAVKNPVNENTGEVKTEITDLPETPDIPEPEIIEENPIEKIDTVPVKDKEETAYLPYQKLEP